MAEKRLYFILGVVMKLLGFGVCLLGVVLVAAGCGSDLDPQPGNNPSNATQGGAPQALQGAWRTDCNRDSDGLIRSNRSQITFGQESVVAVIESFTDRNCEKLANAWTLRGSFRVGSNTVEPRGAIEVDYTINSVLAVFHEQRLLDDAKRECRVTDWSLHEELELSNTHCGHSTWLAKGPFSIVRVEGQRLQVGQETPDRSGRTPFTRHRRLMQGAFARAQ